MRRSIDVADGSPREYNSLLGTSPTAAAATGADGESDGLYGTTDDSGGPGIDADGTNSVLTTVINVTVNVAGAGCLALPDVFDQSSLVLGIFLLFFNCSLTVTNLYFIVSASSAVSSAHPSCTNYGALVRHTMGKHSLIPFIALVLTPFGALVAYSAICSTVMPPVVVEFFGANPDSFIASDTCWLLISAVLFFLLCLQRKLGDLFVTSVAGFVTIFFAVFVVVYRFFDGRYSISKEPASIPPDFKPIYLRLDIFKSVPVLIFSFMTHSNAYSHAHEMRNRSVPNAMRAFVYAHIILIIMYMSSGLFGVLMFDSNGIRRGAGNIIESLARDDSLANVARICLYVTFLVSYPVLAFGCKSGIKNLFYFIRDEQPVTNLPFSMIALLSFCLVSVSSIIAYFVKNIDTILAFSSSLSGSIVVLMLPAWLFLSNVRPAYNEDHTKLRAVAWFSIGYGVVVSILGLYSSVLDIVDEDHHHHNNNTTI